MGTRNQSVEFFRCCLMFGICLLHAASFAESEHRWLVNMLCPCVDAFVFISGWYGCRFSLKKVFRLLGVGLFCATAVTVWLEASGGADSTLWNGVRHLVQVFRSYWFLHAYVVLLVVAPLINPLFEREYNAQADRSVMILIMPFLGLAFGWSFLATLRVCQTWLPIPSGLGSYTSLTLAGVYVAARYCRWSGCLDRIPIFAQWAILLVSLIASSVGLGRYSSPVALLASVFSFSLFANRKYPGVLCGAASWMAPSMFSVYLLQTNDMGIAVAKKITSLPYPHGCLVIMTALAFFFGGVLMDVPRRLIVCFRRGIVNK